MRLCRDGGRHGEETFLHLVILGGEAAVPAVLEVEVAPLAASHPEASRAAVGRAVRVARERGAVVIVAHYWRTALAMERDGTRAHLPEPEALAALGVHGFEVANHHLEGGVEERRIIRRIDRLCRERGLLRIASSDDHGWPRGIPVASLIRGELGADERAVLAHLSAGGAVEPMAARFGSPDAKVWWPLLAPIQALRYVSGMPWAARLSWWLWLLSALLLVRRLSDSRPGSS